MYIYIYKDIYSYIQESNVLYVSKAYVCTCIYTFINMSIHIYRKANGLYVSEVIPEVEEKLIDKFKKSIQ